MTLLPTIVILLLTVLVATDSVDSRDQSNSTPE
jgi:hypothetical protein